MKNLHTAVIFILFLFSAIFSSAEVKLPRLISDGMILQRDSPLKIWGWAAPNEALTVNFNKADYKTSADAQGDWVITLPAQKAGGPYTLTIKASNTIQVNNILTGDVWLCSGQSNMETPISRVMSMFGDEINSYSNSKIRYVKIPLTYNFHAPQTDVPPCTWTDVTPETAQDFSAVAYFFAKEMFEKTNIPVGIINSSVGGSPAEAWISEEALQAFPAYLNDKRICESDEFVAEMQRLGSLPGRRWQEMLNQQDKGLNEAVKWSSPTYDDSSWQTSDLLDNSWGRKNSRPVNGVFWFRKTIEIPADFENQDAMLYMGRIVDADSVFVNGKFVGTTGYQYPPRNYQLPKGILKAGKNLITVRLVSQGGIPEFVKDKPYKIVCNNREISLTGEWKYRLGVQMNPPGGGGITFQYKPVGLYNAMITPLQNFPVKGFIWYQGESNTDRYIEYYDLMSTLIGDWRNLWKKDLPFLIVQLANYMEPALLQQNSGWAELRDVQRKLSQTVPNTGLAVTIDVGEWNDIHPLNKKDVGKRLALQARSIVYGEKIVKDGPVYQSKSIDGNKIILSFKEGTNDLLLVDELKGFAIAGSDGIFKLAKASIDGNKVIVWSDEVAQPVKVRYAWANNPDGANLRNKSGLPASPFQSE
ncbi:MAG: beta galactosidase jelly roll domain-containing protein [Dysgonamonadaceae bacterium]|jgi:sialate O-acetylesterase|nr:beta galactosidase jelly roll domain-containing protein [Dysgonamonadaceae bacterium]